MRCRGRVVLAALAACGDNAAAPPDAAPPPYPDAPPYVDQGPTIDYDEGPEPNGFGVIEASGAPAGIISGLKDLLILHGHLAPFRDADHDGALDPDVDTFVIQAFAPARLQISVDGASFHMDGQAGELDHSGLTTTGTVELHDAGTYNFSVANRSVWEPGTGSDEMPATGEYLVTIRQTMIPTVAAAIP